MIRQKKPLRLGSKRKSENTPLAEAEKAVARYETSVDELSLRREKFGEDFPEADKELESILVLEDMVNDQLQTCKELVRVAGQTVGGFRVQLRKSSAGYDGLRVLEEVCRMTPTEAGEVLKELYDRGFFKSIKVDNKVASVLRSTDPELCQPLEEAWKSGGEELTTAVIVPKMPRT